MKAEQRFAAIRRRYLAARDRSEKIEDGLRRKYGPDHSGPWLTRVETRRRTEADVEKAKHHDAMFDLLAEISPRDWTRGVAAWWVVEELAYADAVTDGQLSVVPQPGYGYGQADAEAFARPLRRES